MLIVKQIIEVEFQHLCDFLPSMYEPHRFIYELEDFSEDACELLSDGPSGGRSQDSNEHLSGRPNKGQGKDSNDEPYLNSNAEIKLMKEMF